MIRPGPIQGGSVHPFIRRAQRAGADHLRAPAAGEVALQRTFGVPLFQEQVMQMAIDVGRLHPRRGRRAAPGDGLEALRRADGRLRDGSTRHGRARDHRRRWPTRSSRSSRRSRTSASPRATRSASPTSCTRARGSSCTTRRRSARRCSTPSRWASTRRRRWSPTPGGTASRSAAGRQRERRRGRRSRPRGPVANAASVAARRRGAWAGVRLGLSSVRTIGDELAEKIDAGADGPYTAWRTSPAGSRSPRRRSRRSPRRARSTASAWPAARRCGRPARSRRSGPTCWPARRWGPTRRCCPGMTDVEQTIADLWATGIDARRLPDAARPAELDALGVAADRRPGRPAATGKGAASAASSRTGSDRRPRAGPRSSTSRTRPG